MDIFTCLTTCCCFGSIPPFKYQWKRTFDTRFVKAMTHSNCVNGCHGLVKGLRGRSHKLLKVIYIFFNVTNMLKCTRIRIYNYDYLWVFLGGVGVRCALFCLFVLFVWVFCLFVCLFVSWGVLGGFWVVVFFAGRVLSHFRTEVLWRGVFFGGGGFFFWRWVICFVTLCNIRSF